MTVPTATIRESRTVLTGVSWQTFKALLAEIGRAFRRRIQAILGED